MSRIGPPGPPWSEAERLAALDRYAILDTGREPAFDAVAELAADLLGAPIAVVNLIAAARQWFKAEVGIGRDELPLDVSICRHAILQPGVFVVPDLAADPRFAQNPLVTAAGGLRFYAGALLETPDGLPLGTVCVLDTQPRPDGITDRERRVLLGLAAQTMAQLELRRSEAALRIAGTRAQTRGRRLALLAEAATRLLAARDAAAMIDGVHGLLAAEFGVAFCFHYACAAHGLGLVASAGLTAAQRSAAAHVELGHTVCGTVAVTRTAAHVTDIQASDDPDAAFLRAVGIDTYFSAPLLWGGELLGTLSFGRRGGAFSAGERAVLRTIVANVATALERLHREAEGTEQGRLLAMIAAGRSLSECLMEVTASISLLRPGVRACILVPDAAGTAFERTYSANVPGTFRDGIQGATIEEMAIGTCGTAVWAGKPVSCPDIAHAGPWSQAWRNLCLAHGFRSCHSEPVLGSDGRCLASLAMYFGEARELTEGERRVAIFGARIAAVAIERDRLHAALGASEDLHRMIIDSARDFAIITLDPDGTITSWNSGAERMMGYTEAQAVGQPGDVFFTPEDRADHAPEREQGIARERGRAENERWHLRRDGTRFWGSGLMQPLGVGRQRGFVKIFQDRTEAHQAREDLRRLNEALEVRVLNEVAAREAAQAQLAHAQRMEALGQLAGGIAHDLNNVLQAVGGGGALIARRPEDAEAVRRIARMIVEASERGSAVTRRLLAFARRGDLRSEAVAPGALLVSMREILTHTLGAGIEVRVDTPDGLPALLADKGQLETALVNLATNARDAMGGQGILTFAARVETWPRDAGANFKRALAPGTYVRLVVTDTGAGMPPEVLARATEPFFTTKPQGQGTGLGLATVRGFVEQSGGALLVESELGRGTSVSVWLPLAASAPAEGIEARRARPSGTDPQRPWRVLLVDDEAVVRDITAQGLQAAGFAVEAAPDGQAALALLDAGQPVDLIVSDLSMPGMDGLAVIHEAQRRNPEMPAILLTGFATNAAELALGGAISGTFSLLRKPIAAEVLAERVAVLLEGRGAPMRRQGE